MNVAIIPARGGSKRIPRKNIRAFEGKPIIAYSIEAALATGLFERVVVSTDDTEIASVAETYGAEIPFLRPAEIADDMTGTAPVVKHAVEALQASGDEITCACCIYATAPFVRASDLTKAYEALMAAAEKAFAFSVTSFAFPVQRALAIRDDGLAPIYPEFSETRSQDLEEAYHDAGQFYWGRANAWMVETPLFSHASIPVVLPRHRVQDIDTLEDWTRAEHMFRALGGAKP
ncbi:MAG: pseudaminic acid cytidylyltransferase [Alphaproteobacteria bacterium]|jgi:pseudaminic acid cytidylyltransferase|nr:pseudaminic acid cytidylyltransferase [Alphaproteobacteria bacterium]